MLSKGWFKAKPLLVSLFKSVLIVLIILIITLRNINASVLQMGKPRLTEIRGLRQASCKRQVLGPAGGCAIPGLFPPPHTQHVTLIWGGVSRTGISVVGVSGLQADQPMTWLSRTSLGRPTVHFNHPVPQSRKGASFLVGQEQSLGTLPQVLVLFKFFKMLIGVYLLYNVVLVSAVQQNQLYIYPFFFEFPFHLGHHRAWNKAPCALQSVRSWFLWNLPWLPVTCCGASFI